jgi:hypothetical protein
MNIYTSMAVDAFRKQEQARRRLQKAENESIKAGLRVPREELDIYALETGIIRMEFDEKDAKANHDQEGADRAMLIAAKMRRQLKELLERSDPPSPFPPESGMDYQAAVDNGIVG